MQRAVRWVRENAHEYEIDKEQLAAAGGSSDGHLSSMLGLLPGDGNLKSKDPLERRIANVQAVVALAADTDLTAGDWPMDTATVVASFVGRPRWPTTLQEYFDASLVSHVASHGGTKFLLIHGDQDAELNVPLRQALDAGPH